MIKTITYSLTEQKPVQVVIQEISEEETAERVGEDFIAYHKATGQKVQFFLGTLPKEQIYIFKLRVEFKRLRNRTTNATIHKGIIMGIQTVARISGT